MIEKESEHVMKFWSVAFMILIALATRADGKTKKQSPDSIEQQLQVCFGCVIAPELDGFTSEAEGQNQYRRMGDALTLGDAVLTSVIYKLEPGGKLLGITMWSNSGESLVNPIVERYGKPMRGATSTQKVWEGKRVDLRWHLFADGTGFVYFSPHKGWSAPTGFGEDPRCGAGKKWVNAYVRQDGPHVSGYCRGQ